MFAVILERNVHEETFSDVRPLVTLTVKLLQLLCTVQVGNITAVRSSNRGSHILAKEIMEGIQI